MNRGEHLLRGSGIAQQVEVGWRPYFRFGDVNWDPAALGVMSSPAEERAARAEKFDLLREAGLSVPEAGAALGMTPESARWHERRRRAGAQ